MDPTSGDVPDLTGVVLALDVDGVLLDPLRGGAGPWVGELSARFGVDGEALGATFFSVDWDDVIVGRAPIEARLASALDKLGWTMSVEELLECWFEADLAVDSEVVVAVSGWVDRGVRIVLATNQEHRRAAYLDEHLGEHLPISGITHSAGLGVVKSDPAFFPAAQHLLGVDGPPSSVVFVDDARENVAAATAYGWRGIHYTGQSGWVALVESALAAAAADN